MIQNVPSKKKKLDLAICLPRKQSLRFIFYFLGGIFSKIELYVSNLHKTLFFQK